MGNPIPVQKQPLQLAVVRLPHAEGLPLPKHETPGAACIDLIAATDTDIVLATGERAVVPTGLCFAIPEGYHGQIWPRSGMAAKNGIDTLAGMIDADYRGEVKVALINFGAEPFTVTRGMRIAQFLIAPYASVTPIEVTELPSTGRGDGGFGSTGKHAVSS